MEWKRILRVLPPPEQEAEREKAIGIIARSFFKMMIAAGFKFKDVMHFINSLMDVLTQHGRQEPGDKPDARKNNDTD